MIINVDDTLCLEFLDEAHAATLFNLINDNRVYLSQWLPWVENMRGVEHAENYISNCKRQAIAKTDFAFAIMFEKKNSGKDWHSSYQRAK